MYEQGYAQVAGKYNYLNREMTNPMSIAFRDKFLKSAKENLKNLSSMDLSMRQNVENASTVFEPFYKNRSALGDMALTEHWNQQTDIAESFRLKDGGKEFSEDNLRFVQMQREQFRQADPSQWQSFYSGRRSYSPYYNYYDEVQKAMEKFKPSSIKTIQKNGFYMNIVDDKSWTKEELSEYLNGTLSDKAKQQMNIEASVRLGSNPEALSSAYLSSAQQSLPVLNNALQQLNQQIKATKDAKQIEALKLRKDYYQEKKDDLTNNMTAIQSGDMSYVTNNSEKLARQLYMNSKVQGFVDAFDHKDIAYDIKFDDAALTIYKEQQANWRTKYTQDRTDAREGKETPMIPVRVKAEEAVAPNKTSLNNDVKTAKSSFDMQNRELMDHVALALKKPGQRVSEVEFQQYLKQNPNDPKVFQWAQADQNYKDAQKRVETFDKNADQYARQVMNANGQGSFEKAILYKKAVQDAEAFALGRNSNTQGSNDLASRYTSVDNRSRGDLRTNMGLNNLQATNNRVLNATNNAGAVVEAGLGLKPGEGAQLYSTYQNLIKNYNLDAKTTQSAVTRPAVQIPTTSKDYKMTADFLQQNTLIDAGNIVSINHVFSPKGTDLQFSYNETKEKKVDIEQAKNLLTTRFPDKKVSVDKDNRTITVEGLGTLLNPNLDPYKPVAPEHRTKLYDIERADGPVGGYEDEVFYVQHKSGKNMRFTIKKYHGETTEGDGYYLYGENGSIDDTKYPNALDPYKLMNSILNADYNKVKVLFEPQ